MPNRNGMGWSKGNPPGHAVELRPHAATAFRWKYRYPGEACINADNDCSDPSSAAFSMQARAQRSDRVPMRLAARTAEG
jgi:hypothetical protein